MEMQRMKFPKQPSYVTSRSTLFGSTSMTDESGVGVPIIIEATGELKVVNYGKSSGTITAIALETTGEQKIVNYGKDSGGTIDAFLTDDLKKLWIRSTKLIHESWAADSLDPVTLDNASFTTIYTGTSGYEALVEIELSVIDGNATRTCDISCDPTSTATSTAFLIANDMPVPLPDTDNPTPVRLGPYAVGPGGTIKGQASAASAINARAIPIRLEKLT